MVTIKILINDDQPTTISELAKVLTHVASALGEDALLDLDRDLDTDEESITVRVRK